MCLQSRNKGIWSSRSKNVLEDLRSCKWTNRRNPGIKNWHKLLTEMEDANWKTSWSDALEVKIFLFLCQVDDLSFCCMTMASLPALLIYKCNATPDCGSEMVNSYTCDVICRSVTFTWFIIIPYFYATIFRKKKNLFSFLMDCTYMEHFDEKVWCRKKKHQRECWKNS